MSYVLRWDTTQNKGVEPCATKQNFRHPAIRLYKALSLFLIFSFLFYQYATSMLLINSLFSINMCHIVFYSCFCENHLRYREGR